MEASENTQKMQKIHQKVKSLTILCGTKTWLVSYCFYSSRPEEQQV